MRLAGVAHGADGSARAEAPECFPPVSDPVPFEPWRNRYPVSFRRVCRALAYVLAVPPMWLLDRLGLLHRIVLAFTRLLGARAHHLQAWHGYQPGSHDVIVCANMKSGTNWAMQITHQIAHRGRGEFDHIYDVVPWPDCFVDDFALPLEDPAPLAASPTGLRVIKTHLPWSEIPYAPSATYVCVVRDPKDVVVSAWHFVRDVLAGPLIPPLRTWIELILAPDFPASWAASAASYWAERERPNVLFLSYREMKQDLDGAVRRIAAVMDVELGADEHAAVVARSSFDYMKSIDERFYPGAMSPFAFGTGRLMRRGQQGASHELLTRKQQEHVDAVCRAQLAGLGSDLPYDEICTPPR